MPAGRKASYYAHYKKHIMERHGVARADAAVARAYALATRRAKRMRLAGAQTGGSSASAGAHATASNRMADVGGSSASSSQAPTQLSHVVGVPLAELSAFLPAWRADCPWLIVCQSVSMFTCCIVCE